MAQSLPDAYQFDPTDPRSPSQEQWDRMPVDERARVVAMLPDSVLKEVDRPNAAARRDEQRLILAAIAHAMAEAERATTQAARADAAELKLAEALAEIARLRSPS